MQDTSVDRRGMCHPRCRTQREQSQLPTAVQQLVFDYLTHDDVVTLVVCARQWPSARPFDEPTIRTLWPRPVNAVTVLHKAASCGCWAAVASASACAPRRLKAELFPPWVMYDAVRRGELKTIEALHTRSRYEPHIAMEIAGHAGDLELIEWLYNRSRSAKSPCSSTTTVIDLLAGRDETAPLGFEYVNWNVHVRAAKKNASYRVCVSRAGLLPHLPVFGASQKQRYPIFAYAVSVGAFDLVEKLLQRAARDNCVLNYEHTLSLAAANGKLEVVRWLLAEQRASLDEIPQAMVLAAQHGHVNVLRFLHDTVIMRGPSLVLKLREQEQLRTAALHGRLEVVQFLTQRLRVDITAQVFDNAARQGHMNVVVWLAEHGGSETILPTTILRAAVCGGNTDLVRWLVETRHCPVYREAAVHAAEENCLDVLQWLHQYACKQATKEGRPTPQHILDYDSISLAALRCQGSIDCATWLIENVSWVDPNYSARELRSLDKWYETALRTELGISFRNDPPTVGQHRLPETSVAQRKGIDRFLMALLRHRPQAAVSIKWMPRWAVWTRSMEALELLRVMPHFHLWSLRTVRAATVFTTDSQLVMWLLRNGEPAFARDPDTRRRVSCMIRKWATKHESHRVLDEMVENHTNLGDDSGSSFTLPDRSMHHASTRARGRDTKESSILRTSSGASWSQCS